MQRISIIISVGVCCCLVVSASSEVSLKSHSKTHVSKELGIQFEYSDRFVSGRYKVPTLPQDQAEKMQSMGLSIPFANTVVLVETSDLGEYNTNAIPVGKVAAISFDVRSGIEAQIYKQKFCRDKFKRIIGKYSVYQLPAYPGPYGENAFYYLVAVPQGLLEISAHKVYIGKKRVVENEKDSALTHYSDDIEAIIQTLKTIPLEKLQRGQPTAPSGRISGSGAVGVEPKAPIKIGGE